MINIKKLSHNINKLVQSQLFGYFIFSLILIFGFLLRLYKINTPLADWHSWRQVDTSSVTKNYLENGINLLYPRYHDISSIQTGYQNPEGYRFVEFPVYNLAHAGVFKVSSGTLSLEVAGRLTNIIFALLVATGLYLFVKRASGNSWLGLISSAFYMFIPYSIFYTRVILPDAMAAGFGVLGIWMFWEYIQSERPWQVYLSAIFFSLGLLTKPFVAFYGLPVVFMAIKKYKMNIFKNFHLLLALDIALIPMLLWRIWISQKGLLVGVAHYKWAFNGDGIRFRPSFWRWIFAERIAKLILGFWGLVPFAAGIIIRPYKKLDKYYQYVLWWLLGMLLYVSIIATANVRHDYYQIYLIPAVAIFLSFGSWQLWNNSVFNKSVSRIMLIFSIGMMVLIGFYEVKDYYKINDPAIMIAGAAVNKVSKADDLVVAPYNGNTAFLYQTGRWGWPVVETSIDDLIDKGADWFVSTNKADPDYENFKKRFRIFKETDDFLILDLHHKI